MNVFIMSDKIYYSYNDIHNLCIEISDKIKEEFNPDLILAIGGGGFIPARIMRTKLNVPIYAISVKSYDDNNNNNTINVLQWINKEHIENKRVLIVDEIDDTRKTLDFVTNKVKNELNPSTLGVAVIHNKNKPKYRATLNCDYYTSAQEIEDIWVVYPWE